MDSLLEARRAAILREIDKKRADKAFMARIRRLVRENHAILRRLA